MKLQVIGAPRCGGTAYAQHLSKLYNCTFFNEPFKYGNIWHKISDGAGVMGGGMYNNSFNECDHMVAHHITSQYVANFITTPNDHEIIIVERRDRWRQLLSYCLMLQQYDETKHFHNLEHKSKTITIPQLHAQRMIDEWIILDYFKKSNPKHQVVIYEELPNLVSDYRKTVGHENVIITNLSTVRYMYDHYWRRR